MLFSATKVLTISEFLLIFKNFLPKKTPHKYFSNIFYFHYLPYFFFNRKVNYKVLKSITPVCRGTMVHIHFPEENTCLTSSFEGAFFKPCLVAFVLHICFPFLLFHSSPLSQRHLTHIRQCGSPEKCRQSWQKCAALLAL